MNFSAAKRSRCRGNAPATICSKGAACVALRDAIKRIDVQAIAYTDGMTVIIDDHTVREPDALVQYTPIDLDSLIADAPVIVVEVASPSSECSDMATKLAEYFSVASIEHYLIVDLNGRVLSSPAPAGRRHPHPHHPRWRYRA